jgi:hypothetical protein
VPAYREIVEHDDLSFKPIAGLQLTREIVVAYQQSSALLTAFKQLVEKHSDN